MRVRVPRRHKYNAKPTMYRGWRFDSQAEANQAAQLDLLKDAEVVAFWMRQIPIDLTNDDRTKIDFLVIETDGTMYGVEVKGVETDAWRKIRKLWIKYGPFPLRVVRGGNHVETLWQGEPPE